MILLWKENIKLLKERNKKYFIVIAIAALYTISLLLFIGIGESCEREKVSIRTKLENKQLIARQADIVKGSKSYLLLKGLRASNQDIKAIKATLHSLLGQGNLHLLSMTDVELKKKQQVRVELLGHLQDVLKLCQSLEKAYPLVNITLEELVKEKNLLKTVLIIESYDGLS